MGTDPSDWSSHSYFILKCKVGSMYWCARVCSLVCRDTVKATECLHLKLIPSFFHWVLIHGGRFLRAYVDMHRFILIVISLYTHNFILYWKPTNQSYDSIRFAGKEHLIQQLDNRQTLIVSAWEISWTDIGISSMSYWYDWLLAVPCSSHSQPMVPRGTSDLIGGKINPHIKV